MDNQTEREMQEAKKRDDGLLGIVLLINTNGSLELSNIHPAHHARLKRYDEAGISYQLRRNKSMMATEPLAVGLYLT
ncbi:MAG: hypothetical protein AABX85_04425 [Nanoarchaeota archaeon]